MTQSHPRSAIIPNSGHISRMRLVRWMAVTYTVHLLQTNTLPIEIAKVLYLKIVCSGAHSTFNSSLLILGGRGLQPMHEYTRAPFQMAWIFLKANIIWPMLV